VADVRSAGGCEVGEEGYGGFDAGVEGEGVCCVEDFAGFGVDLAVEEEERGDCVAEVCGVG
jgi:hypothetical protein